MPTEPLPIEFIRSIIKWELQSAPKRLLAAAHGKDRMVRDNALNELSDRIASRLGTYTIAATVHGNDFARLAVPNRGPA